VVGEGRAPKYIHKPVMELLEAYLKRIFP